MGAFTRLENGETRQVKNCYQIDLVEILILKRCT